jgi:uncharacterized protein YciI
LWAAIAHVKADADAIQPHVEEHLEYMAKLEEKGRLWASGPFIVPGGLVGDGLTILRADTEEDARALMDAEAQAHFPDDGSPQAWPCSAAIVRSER